MRSSQNHHVGPVIDTIEKNLKYDESEETCPLFMDGLPNDFASNPQLAALASLMNDDDEENDVSKSVPAVTGQKGGGKVVRKLQRRAQRHDAPYLKQPTKKVSSASLGEAQLFLKMWSLK